MRLTSAVKVKVVLLGGSMYSITPMLDWNESKNDVIFKARKADALNNGLSFAMGWRLQWKYLMLFILEIEGAAEY